jgi:hypothetical protein
MEEIVRNSQINPKYIRGVKGWLVVFILTLIFIGTNLSRLVIEELFDPRRDFFNLRIEIQMVNIALMFSGIFLPFFIAFILYKKKSESVLITKIFLALLPFYAFAWHIFKSKTMPYDIEHAVIAGLFIVGCLYSIPWFFYFNFSKRVNNTYLFNGTKMPKIFQCPFCLEKLELDNEEREAQEIVCPNCNKTISEKTM